jgi:hypothetical protein
MAALGNERLAPPFNLPRSMHSRMVNPPSSSVNWQPSFFSRRFRVDTILPGQQALVGREQLG